MVDRQGLVALVRDVGGVLVANLHPLLTHMPTEVRAAITRQLGMFLMLMMVFFGASAGWWKREGAAGVSVARGLLALAGNRLTRTLRGPRWRAALDPERHGDVLLFNALGDRVLLPMRAEAEDCLVAFGAQRPGQVSYWLASPPSKPSISLLWVTTWVISWAASSQGMPFVPMVLSLLAALVAQRWFAPRQPTRLLIGDDGLQLDSWRERFFVPYRDLARCDVSEDGLVLDRRDGTRMEFPGKMSASAVLLIQDEIRRRSDVFEQPIDHAEPLLRRGERSVSEWRESLASLRKPGHDYRSQSLDEPTLHALMTNPAADAEQRLGAALALSTTPSERRRIRVAARACLEPRMRVALEQIARDDTSDEALAQALDEASSATPRRAR